MKEPLLTLPISKVKIMQFSPGELLDKLQAEGAHE